MFESILIEPRLKEPPYDKLWKIGSPNEKQSIDYVKKYGFMEENVADLLQIVALWVRFDDKNFKEPDSFASVHAWRALGQMRRREAVEVFLPMLNELYAQQDDWSFEEWPEIFAEIGPEIINDLCRFLFDASNMEFPRGCVLRGLAKIAEKYPGHRAEILDILAEQLDRHNEEPPLLNAFLVDELMNLKGVEKADAIERAYADGSIDIEIIGFWKDVREKLGYAGQGLAPDYPPDCDPNDPGAYIRKLRQERYGIGDEIELFQKMFPSGLDEEEYDDDYYDERYLDAPAEADPHRMIYDPEAREFFHSVGDEEYEEERFLRGDLGHIGPTEPKSLFPAEPVQDKLDRIRHRKKDEKAEKKRRQQEKMKKKSR